MRMNIWMWLGIACLLSGQAAAGEGVMSEAEWRSLATQRNCVYCHERGSDGLGPSLKEIAAEYAGLAEAEELLLRKVIDGGVGKWGSTMMPSQSPPSSREEIRAMVRYMLTPK